MIVTIWRHGEAGRAAVDSERELTSNGQAELSAGARAFVETCDLMGLVRPSLMLYSGWRRTTQTANIISAQLSAIEARIATALEPGHDVFDVDAMLEDVHAIRTRSPGHVLLVSHQPLVSQLSDYYLGSVGSVPRLSPGARVTLEMDVIGAGCAQLLFWSAPPAYQDQP